VISDACFYRPLTRMAHLADFDLPRRYWPIRCLYVQICLRRK
jgi:hypothetical protein